MIIWAPIPIKAVEKHTNYTSWINSFSDFRIDAISLIDFNFSCCCSKYFYFGPEKVSRTQYEINLMDLALSMVS